MPAYNFSPEHAENVERGIKTQTIRQTDKGAKIGDTAYLFTGQRTPQCRSLGTGTLVMVQPISLYDDCIMFDAWHIFREQWLIDYLARADGFNDYNAMAAWFREKYKIKSLTNEPFLGYLHSWILNKEAKK